MADLGYDLIVRPRSNIGTYSRLDAGQNVRTGGDTTAYCSGDIMFGIVRPHNVRLTLQCTSYMDTQGIVR